MYITKVFFRKKLFFVRIIDAYEHKHFLKVSINCTLVLFFICTKLVSLQTTILFQRYTTKIPHKFFKILFYYVKK